MLAPAVHPRDTPVRLLRSTPSSAPRARRPAGARRRLTGAAAVALTTTVAPAAAHAAAGGGISLTPSAKDRAREVVVRHITCMRGCSSISSAKAGSTLRFTGPRLSTGKRVVYLGGAGDDDDVMALLRIKRSGRSKIVTALLPKRAKSGPVAIEIAAGARSPASTESVSLPVPPTPVVALAPLPGNGPFFPIRGKYEFGTGTAAFGGGRGHEGQDVFAACGTPLVAAEGGVVKMNAFQSRAGNYLVIDVDGADRDEAYMHMRTPALVKEGDTVAAGVQVGEVGDTGHADGCHLHFELWTGHWQGVGGPGTVIDPLPTLKAWAAAPPPASAVLTAAR